MSETAGGTAIKEKWYKKRSFSLLPIWETKEADQYNAKSYYFSWLFLIVKDAISPHISFSLDVADRITIRISPPYINIWLSIRILPSRLHFSGWRK